MTSTPEDILAELGLLTADIAEDEAAAEALLAGDTQQAETPPAQPDPAPVGQPADKVDPLPATPDPKLEALIAREAKVVEAEAAFKEHEAFLADLDQRTRTFEQAKRDFAANPIAFLQALQPDINFDSLARTLWYEKLGDAAPIEHRITQNVRAELQEVRKTRAELESERQRIAEENARKEADAAEARRVEGLRGYLSSVPSAYASVQHLAKQKPDVAVRMMRDAARMIAPGLKREPTAEETADAVQKYLDEIGYVASSVPVPATPAQTQASAQPASPPTSIRNSHSAVQAGRVPPDENDPRVKRRAALQEMAAVLGDPSLANIPVDW